MSHFSHLTDTNTLESSFFALSFTLSLIIYTEAHYQQYIQENFYIDTIRILPEEKVMFHTHSGFMRVRSFIKFLFKIFIKKKSLVVE